MLEINSLSKSFGKNKVLDGLTLSFDKGICGLLGPNGSGKTTLLRCISDVYPIKQGSIMFNSESIRKADIGYLPQKFGVFKELTVFEAMQFFANLKGIDKKSAKEMCESCIETVNLTEKLDKKVKTLSGGMLRRLGIAQTLIGNPDIILFDEPTAGLDPEERIRFKNIVSSVKKDKLILISTHIVEDIDALCDNVAVMDSGKIKFNGSCEALRKQAENKVFVENARAESALDNTCEVIRRFEQNGENKIRFISKSFTASQSVAPELEDGYICVLRNI